MEKGKASSKEKSKNKSANGPPERSGGPFCQALLPGAPQGSPLRGAVCKQTEEVAASRYNLSASLRSAPPFTRGGFFASPEAPLSQGAGARA